VKGVRLDKGVVRLRYPDYVYRGKCLLSLVLMSAKGLKGREYIKDPQDPGCYDGSPLQSRCRATDTVTARYQGDRTLMDKNAVTAL